MDYCYPFAVISHKTKIIPLHLHNVTLKSEFIRFRYFLRLPTVLHSSLELREMILPRVFSRG